MLSYKSSFLPTLKITANLALRCFGSSVMPIKMVYNVFESSKTDKTASPLIIMHGLFGSKQNWRGVGRALEAKLSRKIYTVDARNHGDSPHSSEHGSVHMAADVAELMRLEGISKACVMGHSMGGRTMMALALQRPELVERGIIVDISPISIPRDFSHMEQIFAAMKNISVDPGLSLAQGRVNVEKQLIEVVGSRGTVEFIMMNLRKRPDTGEFYWVVNIDAIFNNLRYFTEFMKHFHHLPPFKGPMCFICGKQSTFMDPKSWPDIQTIFPNAELHWLDAGHLVHFDQPAEFIDIVVNFLKR